MAAMRLLVALALCGCSTAALPSLPPPAGDAATVFVPGLDDPAVQQAIARRAVATAANERTRPAAWARYAVTVLALRRAGAARVEEVAPDLLPRRGDHLLILGPPAGIEACESRSNRAK